MDASTRKEIAMNAIKTLTALSIGLAAAVPVAHADRGDRHAVPDSWVQSGYDRHYDASRPGYRYDDRRVVRREVVVERRPVVERRVVVQQRPVYVQPAPVYREPYPRYRTSAPVVNGGTVVGAIGGAILGSVIGGQIGYGEYQGAATAAGAVIGGVIGSGW
jgi:uncharacterized protein YcfJ